MALILQRGSDLTAALADGLSEARARTRAVVAPYEDAVLRPAWSAGATGGEITLPVYYHWQISTGAPRRMATSRLFSRPARNRS